MKIGSGTGEQRGTIHWHIAARNAVRYQPTDETRMTMAWVEVRKGDSFHRYVNRKLRAGGEEPLPPVRTLDCIDCHNRATHIYQDAEVVLNEALAAGRISRELPFVKQVGLGALLGRYPDKEAAREGIRREIAGHYQRADEESAARQHREIDEMVAVLQEIHARNIHPEMNIGWNAYPSHLGHRGRAGCPRCHNADLVDDQGHAVPYDCTLCHSLVAYDSDSPYEFLQPADKRHPDTEMHRYLQREFLGEESSTETP
jgi:hypothetical protein